ncbi:hypothetical protein VQ7734_04943 [Vibrio quintilis]|uniref:Outer membrane protein beta-barrel domain-containing protein n=2 Tax=Vibrio quintilis TaxID=1117707 RepID=A0A1M7Z2N7_9VIBR|nr:hypothetical protein VQ7734_04943 [Vibrio quintilis]
MRWTLFILVFVPGAELLAKTYIETDPFSFALNGHSVHMGVEDHGFRFQVGTFAAGYPDLYKDNDSFNVEQKGYGVKLDYYGAHPEGAFIGLEYGRTSIRYSLKSGSQTTKKDAGLFGFRIGYKWMLGKRFYVTPWVGIDRNLSDATDVNINGQVYKASQWMLFPTIHIGMEL